MATPKDIVATSAIDTSKFTSAGMNVKFTVLDNILFIAVPVGPDAISKARPSTSGKNKTLGSTLGNVNIPGLPIKLGLNVYTPNTPAG